MWVINVTGMWFFYKNVGHMSRKIWQYVDNKTNKSGGNGLKLSKTGIRVQELTT